ncbi:MAG: hypothetical protein P9X24_04500 [Candidatus Hatepunaea meridiana]|nr:hypothetical protein [Candidatus Hatepunaea meridiana]
MNNTKEKQLTSVGRVYRVTRTWEVSTDIKVDESFDEVQDKLDAVEYVLHNIPTDDDLKSGVYKLKVDVIGEYKY